VNWIVGLRLFLLVLATTLYENPARLTGSSIQRVSGASGVSDSGGMLIA